MLLTPRASPVTVCQLLFVLLTWLSGHVLVSWVAAGWLQSHISLQADGHGVTTLHAWKMRYCFNSRLVYLLALALWLPYTNGSQKSPFSMCNVQIVDWNTAVDSYCFSLFVI